MAAPAAPPPSGENPYGIMQALSEGGIVAIATFSILVIMSAASWYILFTKLFEQQKIMNQGKRARENFWRSNSLREGAAKLEKNSAYRQVVDDGLLAQEQHLKLTDPIDQHEWMTGTLSRSTSAINSRLGEGLALLATVGSTAPFVGLFGTVVGIYRALVKIGASGQASIDAVAGPVGEALIMTALGLIVAVPAVMAYNWLIRRNKAVMEDLNAFAAQIHGHMMSGGAIRPVTAAAATSSAPSKVTASSTSPGATTVVKDTTVPRAPTATTQGTSATNPTTGPRT
ncbi:MAG: MotA/TolQ/ExbB proton channel family protein [Sphingomonadaceae bacterium]|nr:MotA/TolQ/ExbB proton channel family protein [Sphingomonadaceae bacterium]